jgi:pterin-4a-carbinolamine dehydratase
MKTDNASVLANLKCKPCTTATPPLPQDSIDALLKQLDGWVQQGKIISKTFDFTNYHQAMSFVNAVATRKTTILNSPSATTNARWNTRHTLSMASPKTTSSALPRLTHC